MDQPSFPSFANIVLKIALILLTPLCSVFAQSLNPDIEISQYSHTGWRLQDGILPSLPQALQQTEDGYLWIGTLDGLLRFDGVRFSRWEPPQGQALPSRQITALKADKDGSLWIGTYSGLAHLANGRLINYSENKSAIEQILIDHTGAVWFTRAHIRQNASAGPLCRVEATHMRCYGPKDGLPFPYAQSLAEDKDGFLWVGTDVAVARWKAGASEVYAPNELRAAAGQHGVEALWPATDGSMWVGMSRAGRELGLQNLSEGKWKPVTAPGFDGRQLKVWALYTDSQNSLWVGTTERGLYRIHNGRATHFGATDGLTSDAPSTIYEDREGTLWVITSEGLDRFRALPVNSYSMRQGLSGPLIRSVFAAQDGSVWITNNGAIDILKNGTLSSLRAKDGLPGEIVQCVFQDRQGRFWAGVDDKLVRYENGRFTVLTLPDGKPVGPVRSIAEDSSGDIWIAVYTGTQYSFDQIHGSEVKQQTFLKDLPPVSSVGADSRSGIWLGLHSGDLASYRDGKVTLYPEPRPKAGGVNPLRDVIMQKDNSVMAAYEEGLIEWRNGESKALTIANGLPCSYIGSFVHDLKQTLYLNMSCGVVAIPREEMERWWKEPRTRINFRFYEASDGARFAKPYNSLSAARSSDGRLWFAGVDVLQMIDPARIPFNKLPPAVSIESVVNDGRSVPLQEGVSLQPHLRSLQFDYTALSFVAPQKVLFRYRLQGHDSDWQNAGTRRQALYNDLAPGSYRFQVIASNNDGIWNQDGASINFVVNPALYQRTSFKLAMVALACITLWMLYLLRISIVTEQVRARLTERIIERERIARDLHDTLLQGFQSVLLRFQTISKRLVDNAVEHREMEETIGRADQVLSEARDKVWQLRESSGSNTDLASYLNSIAERLCSQSGVEFSLRVDGVTRPLLAVSLEEICAISQEALTNAFRHSRAKSILVEIQYLPSELRVRVCDDGEGLPADVWERSRKTKHWGLLGMQERAEKIGATVAFRGRQQGGTDVQLNVPASVCYLPSPPQRLRDYLGIHLAGRNS